MKQQVVHIFGRTPHHYQPMRHFFSHAMASLGVKQEFWGWKKPGQQPVDGVWLYDNGKALLRAIQTKPADTRFVFHGLFDRSIWPRMLLSRFIRRAIWVSWGADIYQFKQKDLSWKKRIAFWCLKGFAGRFHRVVALNEGDRKLLASTLGVANTTVVPYPLIGADLETAAGKGEPGQVRVLLGNSASPANEHFEAIDWLTGFKDNPIEVIAPLNYGGPEDYARQVADFGREKLGSKFTPVLEMLSKDQYDQLLASTDIALFAHHRQQGLYVVYSMFLYGKKMFLRGSTTSFSSLADSGFVVHRSESIVETSWQAFISQPDKEVEHNRDLMLHTFSEQALAPKWQSLVQEFVNAK